MIAAIIAFAVFNHLLNSGILERGGGTARAPYVFFVSVFMRLPMGILVGWLADRGKWYWAVSAPLSFMAAGCAAALFAGGTLGDYAMLGLVNCGGAGIVILIHVLGMWAALWRGGSALPASAGSLVHFVLVAFFNMNTLGISPVFFEESLRRPLTFLVIITIIPLFPLIMLYLVDQRLKTAAQDFFSLYREGEGRKVPGWYEEPAGWSGQTEDLDFPDFESEIAVSLLDGISRREVCEKLSISEDEAREYLAVIREALGGGRLSRFGPILNSEVVFLPMEKEVAALICQGFSQKEAAERMAISISEIKLHLARIQKKLTAAPIREEQKRLAETAKFYGLTVRETQVLEELRRGSSNKQIAERLFITDATVKFHVRNVLRKLGISDRTQVFQVF
ncbi:MAG: LuxR C-terminal-related transcriptional regulator [Clostridiales bacterium]|jgi:DNA-binding NarL/FixJ family response regulator|nr:LuxR C-terminal-related transcriptional regulator [Clostridiales bacterium]